MQAIYGVFCTKYRNFVQNTGVLSKTIGLFRLNDGIRHLLCAKKIVARYGATIKKERNYLIFCASFVQMVQGKELLSEKTGFLLNRWERFRRPDGYFAGSEKSVASSTYTTFLAAIFYELLGEAERSGTIPSAPILERRRSDGGFVELQPLRYSGTNPTAAAVGLLTILGVPLPEKEKTVEFLCRCQHPTGGFQAHARIPVPDLLSSFSALMALYDLDATDQINRSALRNFATSLRAPDGGYFGMLPDQQSDVEYTFYGMALEAML